MTREEACDYLARNPRIAETLKDVDAAILTEIDKWYLPAYANSEEDAFVNVCEVIRALT